MVQQSCHFASSSPKTSLRTFVCGLAMGAADVVPGVSGGTIAFITGIYDQLLNGIKAFDVAFFRMLLSLHIRGALERIPWNFLLPLVCGIGISVFSLARITLYLLHSWPEVLWAFFFGLILSSLFLLVRGHKFSPCCLAIMAAGTLCAWIIAGAEAAAASHGLPQVFFSGFIAACAMILPGISGSFMLVLMGQYEHVLSAVVHLNFCVLLVFAIGGACGLMTFSRVLSACLRRCPSETNAALTGVMTGCLRTIWPWHEQNLPALPPAINGMFWLAVLACALGIILPLAIRYMAGRTSRKAPADKQ